MLLPEALPRPPVQDLTVLALNGGSSSLKFGLYGVQAGQVHSWWTGEVQALGEPAARWQVADAQGRTLADAALPMLDAASALQRIAGLLADGRWPLPRAIGHRVVHGGPMLRAHARIDATLLQRLSEASAFAPLHTPAALALIHGAAARFPGLPQVACFDTAFHAHMPDVATVLPLPRALRAQGVQRYGFHGLSCESIVRQLGSALPPRLLIAHLGNGASVTAVQGGRSVDTSMGLTPSGGLVMGTRSGDLDPGVLVHLLRSQGLDAAGLEDLVDHRSGLLGVSGLASDLRRLHAAAPHDADADLALRLFAYAAAKSLAAMSVALAGIDAIAFTGGIGENDSAMRAAICARLASLGVTLDAARNAQVQRPEGEAISGADSSCRVWVLPSREDEAIARHTAALAA